MMANRSDRDRQMPKNDASIIARPFVRQPIRENHQGLRSMNRAARPDKRQQALVFWLTCLRSTSAISCAVESDSAITGSY